MSKKKRPDFIFNSILVLIIFLYIFMLLIVPTEIAFSDSTVAFVKGDANIALTIAGIVFFIINTAIYLDLLKKKIFKISTLSGKQLSVQKKHPRKMQKDLIIGIILYFLISNIIILSASLNVLFSRYTLTKQGITHYNFLNQTTQTYALKSFYDFEIGTQVYSSRFGTASYFYVDTDGPVNISFIKIHGRTKALEFMKELKDKYNVGINKKDIQYFKKKAGYNNWNMEDKKLFSAIFELNF